MKRLLAVGALVLGMVAGALGFIIEPDDGSTLVVSNATYYGNEGDIHFKFKGFIGAQDGAQYMVINTNCPRVAFTNIVVTTNTFGMITNNCWTPNSASANVYYVMCNFSASATPEGESTAWSAYWHLAQMNWDESHTNYLYGDGAWNNNAQTFFGAVNHYLRVGGNERIAFEVLPTGTNIYVNDVRVDIQVVGEYE